MTIQKLFMENVWEQHFPKQSQPYTTLNSLCFIKIHQYSVPYAGLFTNQLEL